MQYIFIVRHFKLFLPLLSLPCESHRRFAAPTAALWLLTSVLFPLGHDPAQPRRHRVRLVMPEEYDAAVRHSPDLCPLVLAGDHRTGAQAMSRFPLS